MLDSQEKVQSADVAFRIIVLARCAGGKRRDGARQGDEYAARNPTTRDLVAKRRRSYGLLRPSFPVPHPR